MIDTSSLRSQYMTSTGNAASSSSSSSSSTGSSSSSSATTKSTMGKEDFLKLLTTQLKYQDPINPQDSTQFTAQLAQFTSLEQLTNINTNIEGLSGTMGTGQTNTQYAQAINLLGKSIESSSNTFTVKSGQTSQASFTLSEASSKTAVGIYDAGGNLVRTIDLGALKSGTNSLSWDGKNSKGSTVPDGSYSFKVAATNSKGKTIDVTTSVSGTVTGIKKSNGTVKIMIGDKSVSLDDISSVTGG